MKSVSKNCRESIRRFLFMLLGHERAHFTSYIFDVKISRKTHRPITIRTGPISHHNTGKD